MHATADTVMLVVTGNPWDKFGHGPNAYEPWHHPQSGLWLMRAPVEAAKYFCSHGGCYVAPDELQDADQ